MPRTISITDDMRDIMQNLGSQLVRARADLAASDRRFNAYVAQCAIQLGFDPKSCVFDPEQGSFSEKG